jgi:hypothetical protein
MGISNSPDIFHSKMPQLIVGFEFVRAYLDDILVATKDSFIDNIIHLEQLLERLDKASLCKNIEKCASATQEFEYLGYLVTTAVTKVPRGSKSFNWAEAQGKEFQEIKKVITQNALLRFPDFDKIFDIHADASDNQLGSLISQDGYHVPFYIRKLTETQRNYMVGEREMPSIVETLTEFKTMLLEYRIKIYTDHENLTRLTTVSKSPRIQRWQWTIEEFSPSIEYIK